MTQSKFLFGIVLLSVLSLMGCPSREIKPDSTIILINKTNKDILFDFSQKPYPDTTLFEGGSPFLDLQQYNLSLLYANSSKNLNDAWLASFEMDPRPIMLFFFSRDTIDQVPWEKIRLKYNILKRYDLSKSKLDSLNWTIEYK